MIKSFYLTIFIPIFLSIFISLFFNPIFSMYSPQDDFNTKIKVTNSNFQFPSKSIFNLKNNFIWPTPGYSKITSDFGYRSAPTTGAGTYHGGIDIAAPENSSIISIDDGTVTFCRLVWS